MAPRGSNKKNKGTMSSNKGSDNTKNDKCSDNTKEKIELNDDEPNSGFSKYIQSEQGKISKIILKNKKKYCYTLI